MQEAVWHGELKMAHKPKTPTEPKIKPSRKQLSFDSPGKLEYFIYIFLTISFLVGLHYG